MGPALAQGRQPWAVLTGGGRKDGDLKGERNGAEEPGAWYQTGRWEVRERAERRREEVTLTSSESVRWANRKRV